MTAQVVPLGVANAIATSNDAVDDAITFLRQALTIDTNIPNRTELLHGLDQAAKFAITSVADATDDQRRHVGDALAAAAKSVNLQVIVNFFSPEELCVFRASLERASEQLSNEATGQLVGLRAAMETTIQAALASTGPHQLAVALHGDAESLRSMVMDGVAAKVDIRCVGHTLADLLSRQVQMAMSLTMETREALRRMAEWGTPLTMQAIQELHNANALTLCAAQASKDELRQLCDAIGRAAASGRSHDLMHFWTLVHSAVSTVLPMETLTELVDYSMNEVNDTVASDTRSIGELLQLAITSSMQLASAISVELQDAIKNMVEHGVPLPSVSSLRHELDANVALISQALPPEKLVQLDTHFRQVAVADWGDVTNFTAKLNHAIANLPPIAQVLVDATKQTASDLVYNNTFSAAFLNSNLDKKMDDLVHYTREGIHEAMAALAHGLSMAPGWMTTVLSALPPLLRVEILRDFCQTVSLFFTNLYGSWLQYKDAPLVRGIQLVFQTAFNIVSADFMALWANKREQLIDISFGVLLTIIVLTYVAYLWFALSGRHLHKRSDEIRHGHEATTWAELATKQHKQLRVFTMIITLCLSVYLPLTRVCIEILVAAIVESKSSATNIAELVSPSTLRIMQRYSDIHALWIILRIASVVLLVTFTIPLPFLLMRAITENKPTGSAEDPQFTYDIDGERVPFDDKVYARLVASDPSQLRCPYRSLYAGFEQKWSHYKVFQLLFKIALIIPLIVTRQRGIRSIIASVIYALIVMLTSYSTPFNDPLNNVMELSGKMAALITCVGGVAMAFLENHERVQVIIGAVVNIVNMINIVIMIGIMLFGMKKTLLWIKNRFGTLTFSDTVRIIQDAPAATVIPHWDLNREIKHRIWQEFWQSVLLSLPENKAIIQRLTNLQKAVTDSGVENVKRHWQGQANNYIASMRMAARRLLEGVDVFWDDAAGARDGFLDSKSCFGKMYIRPYPFHCVIVYDDSADETIVRDDKFPSFFFLNFSSSVVVRRTLRQKLRALSDVHAQIHLPFSRVEYVTVEDGTETSTTTNAEGQTETKTSTRYTSVGFTCYYTMGVIKIVTNSDAYEMAAGFRFTMTYTDGQGDAVAPHTGVVHHQVNRVAVMGPEHVGLTHEMQESAQLSEIFRQTQDRWIPGLAHVHERANTYRSRLIEQHAAANHVLGDGFWYFVFNNPTLARHRLYQYLATEETNPTLHRFAETHVDALDFLYHRMGFVLSHPACKLWYIFWDDIFARNGDMTRLKPFATDLNPAIPTSMAYHVRQKHELITWLKEKKLWGSPFSWKTVVFGQRSLFHERLLQVLFARMEELMVSK